MKDYRELKIIGDAEEQSKLITSIEQRLDDGWFRDKIAEAQTESDHGFSCRLFTCSETESRAMAVLNFCFDEGGHLYLNNIRLEEHEWVNEDDDITQKNAILEEFLTRFIEPAAIGLNIQVFTTPEERDIDGSMSADMARSFRQFSSSPSQGSEPLDEQKLIDFIIQSHNEGHLLAEDVVKELLKDERWPESKAQEAASKYLFGMDLLKRCG